MPAEHVYFVTGGMVSLVAVLSDGATVEVALVGHEGFVDISTYLGGSPSTHESVGQIPGSALRIKVEEFRAQLPGNPALRNGMNLYVNLLWKITAQSAACNRLHPLRRRCARWLLMCRDRVHADEYPMTHEFLAQMLGVRRAGVSEAVGELQSEGLISYRSGMMCIEDSAGLEGSACECYLIATQAAHGLPS